jgi:hypothetical protein
MNVEKKLKYLGFKKIPPIREEYSYDIRDYKIVPDIEETIFLNGKYIKINKVHSRNVSFYYKEISYSGIYVKKACDVIETIWISNTKDNSVINSIYPNNITSLTDIITILPKNISRDLLINELLK